MLNKDNAVLLVIDIQGRLSTLVHKKDRLFASTIRMIKAAKTFEMPIVWTEQIPEKLGETAPEIKKELEGVELLTKKTFSCSGGEGFDAKLEQLDRKQILVTGIETHICVYQTCVDLIKNGYEVFLVTDACASRLKYNYTLGIERIKKLGATLTSVEMALFEMQKIAEGDQFKQIIQIVK
ncbi:MAG: hydrolase [Candidatus Zixiibacteriota bacterium]|nr:MAG: hydrolase [candidate division Zixibacteria bacterium]